MEKLLSKIRLAVSGDEKALKEMWEASFGDSESDIQRFFNTEFSPENCIVAEVSGKAVSALYLLESSIYINNKPHFSYYVYAVSTIPQFRHNGLMNKTLLFAKEVAINRGAEFLFLVPETDELFSMYEKFGYINGIAYSETVFNRSDFSSVSPENYTDTVDYQTYEKFRLCNAVKNNTVILGESAFKYINSSKQLDNCAVSVSDGYCFYENENGNVIVPELCGNLKNVVSALFSKEKAVNSVTVRLPAYEENRHKFGMYLPLSGKALSDGYFGLPYG